jgi:Rieske Fe-S protein
MIDRRNFYRLGTFVVGGLMGAVLAVPGAAYLFDPLRRRGKAGEFHDLARLNDLQVGVPRSFPVIEERQDAWVKYPREPVGAVWLVRQPDDRVLALTAECPHLGCAVNFAADRKSFFCPCHTSSFDFRGRKLNAVPPRDMDALEVEVKGGVVRVRFQRFRTQIKEKKPLA